MPAAAQAATLIEALDEPALVVERGRVLAANESARALLGRAIEGGDVRLAIRHPEALQRILDGRPSDVEVSGIGAPDRPWLLSVRPVDGGRTLLRLTDRAAVRAAEKMRVDFVANASHELRTPLATIIGYSETLAEDEDLEPAQRAGFAATIRDEARRMLRIVEDLMSLSRIEADRFLAPKELVSIAEIVELAAAHARELADRSGCRIDLDVEAEPGLPPVPGDFGQLVQTLDNLVSNAIRYGCNATGCTVRISARRSDDGVSITVADQGEGIAPQHLPRLTERFYRVDAHRSRDSGGTGLGLSIVKHIVERHRGSLAIRSVPGQGTEVTVRLPLARDGPPGAVTKA